MARDESKLPMVESLQFVSQTPEIFVLLKRHAFLGRQEVKRIGLGITRGSRRLWPAIWGVRSCAENRADSHGLRLHGQVRPCAIQPKPEKSRIVVKRIAESRSADSRCEATAMR